MLFKDFHVDKIQQGDKIQTRRRISRFKKGPKIGKVVPPLKVGSIQPCKTTMFGESFAHVRIVKRWAERLGDISEDDAQLEGGYSKEDYVKGVSEMYGNTIDENEVLWVYEFVLVKLCSECGQVCDFSDQIWKCKPCNLEFGVMPLYVWYQSMSYREDLI